MNGPKNTISLTQMGSPLSFTLVSLPIGLEPDQTPAFKCCLHIPSPFPTPKKPILVVLSLGLANCPFVHSHGVLICFSGGTETTAFCSISGRNWFRHSSLPKPMLVPVQCKKYKVGPSPLDVLNFSQGTMTEHRGLENFYASNSIT